MKRLAELFLSDTRLSHVILDTKYSLGKTIEHLVRADAGEDPLFNLEEAEDLIYRIKSHLPIKPELVDEEGIPYSSPRTGDTPQANTVDFMKLAKQAAARERKAKGCKKKSAKRTR